MTLIHCFKLVVDFVRAFGNQEETTGEENKLLAGDAVAGNGKECIFKT
jgi:hypothetical protein